MKNRFISVLLIVFLCIGSSVVCSAEQAADIAVQGGRNEYVSDSFLEYNKQIKDVPSAEESISINVDASFEGAVNDGEYYVELSQGGKPLSFEFDVPQTAVYELDIVYRATSKEVNDIYVSFAVDGKVPYTELGNVILRRLWEDDGELRVSKNGNQIAASQKEVYRFTNYRVKDAAGLVNGPLKIALEKGKHTVSVSAESSAVQISGITLAKPLEVLPYSEIKKDYGSEEASDIITIQGEDAVLKTSKSLIAKCDNTEVSLTPSDPALDVINYIGSSNWGTIGDEITWKINVEKSGLYYLGYHFRQSYILGGMSYRTLKIDGEVPFKEAESIPFKYKSNWQYGFFEEDEGKPYYFYLDKGEHTVSLTVTMGNVGEYNARLSQAVLEIGKIYRQIVMITGETPDANRDYNLFGQIPDLKENLEKIRAELEDIADGLSKDAKTKSNSQIAVILNMNETITRILKHPYQATDYKSDFYSNYGSLGTVIYEMRKLPLDIDEMQFIPKGKSLQKKNDGFWQKIGFSVKRFVASFVNDYTSLSGSDETDKSITIWLNWGRDQVQVLSSLIENSFTPDKGIAVNLKIVNASLIQAMLSNNGPDLSLRLSRSYPVDYAMRGALYDLKSFDDYEEVCKRFMKGAAVPYEFKGGCYALPDTQSFYMTFYRKDILSEMGLEVPKTWDEFIKAASVLARKNMQVGIPYTQITSVATTDSGIGALNLYPTILLQFGGDLYNDTLSKTTLTSTVSVQAFKFWTDFYTKYSVPLSFDFYNRFRSGEMPLAIQPYTLYATISAAASEINGLWSLAPIPGFETENGEINNIETGGGTGSVILKQSKNKAEAWEFLKWWTSADVQVQYASELESILGPAERQPTANTEALSRMAWSNEDITMLLKQWEKVEELPEVPGGYYTARCVEQAYWNVVNKAANAKSTIVKWGKLADLEISRKRAEYHLDG